MAKNDKKNSSSVRVSDTEILFEMTENVTYRLPSLLLTSKGTLLAACQKRKGERGDWAESEFVLKRSVNGGRTWESEQVLYADEGVCTFTGNLVEDCRTNKIFALFISFPKNDGKNWFKKKWMPAGGGFSLVSSCDDGVTWSDPIYHIPEPNDDGWRGGAAYNNSHGIQLSAGAHAGRLVVGARVFKKDLFEASHKGGLIYSDNGGESWHVGGIGQSHKDAVNGEVTLCEDVGGEVYVNFRNNNHNEQQRRRFYARSDDGGASFYEEGECRGIIAHGCHAGLESLICKDSDKRYFLLSYPQQGPESTRENLGLWISKDGGRSFMHKFLIRSGPSAYSDLISINKKTFGVLWEGGSDYRYQSIGFTILNL